MSYLPPEPKDPKKVSNNRLIIWLVVGALAVYMIVSGIVGLIHGK